VGGGAGKARTQAIVGEELANFRNDGERPATALSSWKTFAKATFRE
jgi:hypothetical protein